MLGDVSWTSVLVDCCRLVTWMGRTQCEGADPDEGLEAHEEKGPDEGGIFGAVGASSNQYGATRTEYSWKGWMPQSHMLRRPRNGTGIAGGPCHWRLLLTCCQTRGVLCCILGLTRQGMYQILRRGGMITGWHGSREVVRRAGGGWNANPGYRVPESKPPALCGGCGEWPHHAETGPL